MSSHFSPRSWSQRQIRTNRPFAIRGLAAQFLAALFLVALFLVVAVPQHPLSAADKADTAEAAAAAETRLLDSVKFLAADDLEGRGVGTSGLDKAAAFLAEQFAGAGLKTELFEGGPFQEFDVTMKAEMGPRENNRLAFLGPPAKEGQPPQKIDLNLGQQFNTLALGGTGTAEAPLVFVGYGITAPELKYDDYADVDVTGKVVLIVRKMPQQGNPHSPFADKSAMRHALFAQKVSNAFQHGAAAVVMVNDGAQLTKELDAVESRWRETLEALEKTTRMFKEIAEPTMEERKEYREAVTGQAESLVELAKRLEGDGDELLPFQGAGDQSSRRTLPVYFCSRAAVEPVVQAALGKGLSALEQEIDEHSKPASQPLPGWSVACESKVEVTEAKVKNVIGVLEGQGPLADETVVVGAHYDHVGMGGQGSGSLAPWTAAVHNGADDNASGTASLLEVIRQVTSNPQAPRRRIVFIAFTGEERGLLGSAHYVRYPLFPLESTVAMVNMDMVGRLKDNKLIVHGTGTAKEFDQLIDDLNTTYQFDITKDPSGYGPSDHASFYAQKVPVYHLFTGTHEDYHRPSDDYDKLNLSGMRRVAGMVSELVMRLATAESRPDYVAIAPPQRGGGDRPYLGSIPDFGRQVEGYALMGVTAASPAEKAGMKAGDVIIKFGESRIAGLEDIDGALRKFKAGDKVPVTVQRGEEQVTLTVTLGEPR